MRHNCWNGAKKSLTACDISFLGLLFWGVNEMPRKKLAPFLAAGRKEREKGSVPRLALPRNGLRPGCPETTRLVNLLRGGNAAAWNDLISHACE